MLTKLLVNGKRSVEKKGRASEGRGRGAGEKIGDKRQQRMGEGLREEMEI